MTSQEANIATLTKELREIRRWAEMTAERAVKTIKELEGIVPPAPRKGKRKTLTKAEITAMVDYRIKKREEKIKS